MQILVEEICFKLSLDLNKWNRSEHVLFLFIFMQCCVGKQNSKEDKIV